MNSFFQVSILFYGKLLQSTWPIISAKYDGRNYITSYLVGIKEAVYVLSSNWYFLLRLLYPRSVVCISDLLVELWMCHVNDLKYSGCCQGAIIYPIQLVRRWAILFVSRHLPLCKMSSSLKPSNALYHTVWKRRTRDASFIESPVLSWWKLVTHVHGENPTKINHGRRDSPQTPGMARCYVLPRNNPHSVLARVRRPFRLYSFPPKLRSEAQARDCPPPREISRYRIQRRFPPSSWGIPWDSFCSLYRRRRTIWSSTSY